MPQTRHRQGALLALLAALLFGAGTPLIKLFFGAVDPIWLGALISLGSGLGVAAVMRVRWRIGPLVTRENRLPFAGSTLIGGAMAPVLLVWGISHAPGSAAALLLNLEAPFTTLIAWLFFREKVGVRFLVGLALVTLGSIVVSLHEGGGQGRVLAGFAVAGACLCWAIDNNCTAQLKGVEPAQFAIFKGLFAALLLFPLGVGRVGSSIGWSLTGAALLVGACSNGIALLVFVMSIQRLGAGRTAAYFATAPFVGAAASVAVLGEPVTPHLLAAAALMALGVGILLSERHVLPERV